MRKRILSILLTLCMVLCLVPTAVFAEGAPTGTPLTQALLGTWLEKEDPYNPNSGKIYKMPGESYYLAEDIYLVGDDADPNSAWPLLISGGAVVTLDLNGHVLDLRGKNISISGSLTLTDSSPNAEHKFRVEDSGLWVWDETQGTETVTGGVITGGTGVDSATGTLGGGVSVSYGSLTMTGGSIVGCTANNGGGVSVFYGIFTMTGGSIAGCTAVKSGTSYGNGGVYVGDSATFNMNGGSIVGCTADSGGGVFVDSSATFTMNDGSIENCTADIGGGVYVGNLATFTMNDGSIVGCTADIGGGVYMGGWAEFNMKGGSIESCTADNGGGVYAGSGAQFEMNSSGGGEGPTIKNCIAVRAGGGVLVDGSAKFTMNDGSIEDCKASGAANAVHADGNFKGAAKNNIPKAQLTGINGGHTGSETDPILIGSAEGLEDFRNRVNKWETTLCAKLVCDIVLNDGTFDENGTYTGANGSTSAEPWTPIGTGSDPYTGTFDGDGHTIKGLYINRDESGIGLFGIVSNATIKNLTVTGYVKGYGSVGGIVGEIPEEGNATIQNCANYCEVTGDTYVGGIVGYIGYNTKGDIRNCANFGTVKGTCTDSYAYVGGIVGRASIGQEMTVVCTACYNVGTVKAKKCAGGLLGYGSMKMDSCYNVGLVEGEEFIGGLVGSALWLIIDGNGMSLVTVDNCYYLDTATEAFGEALFFTGDTSAWRKSKTQFANKLLPLLQNGDENSPWTKTGYLAAAGMTLPLLSWQTADEHTCTPEDASQWESDESGHWQVCSCSLSVNKAAHSGNDDDNCTTEVSCNKCGYVIKLAQTKHKWSDWEHLTTTHTHKCLNDYCTAVETKDCTGGIATCKEQATCDVCHEKYGEKNPENHTGTAEWIRTATTHRQEWNCCHAETVAVEGHEWKDGVCTECNFMCNHSITGPGFDDADHDHKCDICGKVLSECADTDNDHECDLCGKVLSKCADNDKDHKCDLCGKTLSEHSGGTATCTEKAKCEVCGESYGEPSADNHSDLKHVDAKAATETDEGNTEYWYCSGCGKYYKDAEATQEIAKADTVTAKLPEKKSTSPKTGDTGNLAMWIALLFVSGGAAAVAVKKKKQQDR